MVIVDGVSPDETSDRLAKNKFGITKTDRFAADTIAEVLRKTITRTEFLPGNFDQILTEEVLVTASELIRKYRLTSDDLNEMLLRATAAAYFRPNHTVPGHLMLVGDVQAVGIRKDGMLQVYQEGQSFLDSWTGAIKKFDPGFASEWIRRTYQKKPDYPGKYGTHSLILTDSPPLLAHHSGLEFRKKLLYPVDDDVICVIITSDGMPVAKLLPFYTLLPYMLHFQTGNDISFNPVISPDVLTSTEYMRKAEEMKMYIHAERGGPHTDDLSFGVMMLEAPAKTPSPALIKAFFDSQELHISTLINDKKLRAQFKNDQEHNADVLNIIRNFLTEFIDRKISSDQLGLPSEKRLEVITKIMQYIYQYAYESRFSTPPLGGDKTADTPSGL